MLHVNTLFSARWRLWSILLGCLLVALPAFAQRGRPAAPAAPLPDLSKFGQLKPRNIGPAIMSGRITAIDVVRNQPQIIYAGAASGGLWRSTNGGTTWAPLTDSLPTLSVGAVAIWQPNPSIIWMGTGEGNPRNSQSSGAGIYRSLDGGRTWQLMGLERTFNIHRIVLHPTDPNTVYVGVQGSAWGAHPERGVYKTTDGGKTWSQVLYSNPKTGVADLVMDPTNPNKLFAAMWEFERKPWAFKSGGPGSGLHVTHDGGQSWKRLGERDSLPGGEWGRVGVALCASKPNVVYAIVESKKNALYRSDDGGVTWRKATDRNFGDRPFYYHEIHVDPSNENRVYSLFSRVSVSEDGGKTFSQLIDYGEQTGVHADHHAWYIHPDNPDYIVEGNDGGVYISRDRGRTWDFAQNIPVGQFYHVSVDNQTPYNVYGGLQDNGSWVGPAYAWRRGALGNQDFYLTSWGDGFDVVPDPVEPQRYGYSMSQGGSLYRYDRLTGSTKALQPAHPDGRTTLRFNWNAGIAQDPFDTKKIYYGSQFLLVSPDQGNSWQVISPDLTTNDSNKLKESRNTGGLTLDVTGAENHCTILAIAPSAKQQGVLWVGTDDGNVQLTRDGGKTWTNVAGRLPGLPKNAWIPQIVASSHDAGEAFVVANNYRQGNDWNPYLYHTRDYGATWTRLTPPGSVKGYALAVVQDPVARNLLFLGTEGGLWVSFDGGSRWQQWTHGYPAGLSTYDLVIHPTEHDLVIGTFGRGIWVLDDIRPLRAVAQQGTAPLERAIVAFEPPVAYAAQYMNQHNILYYQGLDLWLGENRRPGAMLSFAVKEGKDPRTDKLPQGAKSDTVRIEFFDANGTKVRTLKHVPTQGVNRVYWELARTGQRGPGQPKPKEERERPGNAVLPGVYKVRYTYKGTADSVMLTVKPDPRVSFSPERMAATDQLLRRGERITAAVTEAMDRIRDAQGTISSVNGLLPAKQEKPHEELKKLGTQLQDSLKAFQELVLPKEGQQGIVRDSDLLGSTLGEMYAVASGWYDGPNSNYVVRVETAERESRAFLARVNAFFANTWPKYQQNVQALNLTPFKPMDGPVEIK